MPYVHQYETGLTVSEYRIKRASLDRKMAKSLESGDSLTRHSRLYAVSTQFTHDRVMLLCGVMGRSMSQLMNDLIAFALPEFERRFLGENSNNAV